MLELLIGDKVSIPFTAVNSPIILLGNVGQGRSTTLQKIVLDLIRLGHTGFMYDPYGDLTRAIDKGIISNTYRNNIVIFNDSVSNAEIAANIGNKFILIHSNKLQEGGRHIREKATQLITKLQNYLQENQWCIVDEALEYLDTNTLENYFTGSQKGIKTVLSDSSFINLSAPERKKLITSVDTFIVYKLRNIDAKWLAENNPHFKENDIKAIQQYHFQCLYKNKLTYSASVWPIDAI